MSDESKLIRQVKLVLRMAADRRVSHAHVRSYLALALGFFNIKTGQCNPSLVKLAEASAVDKSTAIKAIETATELGYLDVGRSNGGRNRRNAYDFPETVAQLDRLSGGNEKNGRTGTPETVATDAQKRLRGATRIEQAKEQTNLEQAKGTPRNEKILNPFTVLPTTEQAERPKALQEGGSVKRRALREAAERVEKGVGDFERDRLTGDELKQVIVAEWNELGAGVRLAKRIANDRWRAERKKA